jgi:hypothetical protein
VAEDDAVAGRRKKDHAGLLLALACGATPEAAAQKVGLSVRTVYRRLAEPAFRLQVQELRADMVRRLAGMLTAAGVGALRTLSQLQESAVSESVRLGAARSIVELGCKVREAADLTDRLAAVEAQLESVVEEWTGAPGDRRG